MSPGIILAGFVVVFAMVAEALWVEMLISPIRSIATVIIFVRGVKVIFFVQLVIFKMYYRVFSMVIFKQILMFIPLSLQ